MYNPVRRDATYEHTRTPKMAMTLHPIRSRVCAAAVLPIALVLLAASATPAAGQDDAPRYFLDLHGAGGTRLNTVDTETTFAMYGEQANVRTRQEIGTAKMFDVRFAMRLNPRLGAGLAISGAETKYDGSAAASIPSPVLINNFATVKQNVTGLTRRDLGYHVQALYLMPLSDKLDVTLAAGPSFVQVQQPY